MPESFRTNPSDMRRQDRRQAMERTFASCTQFPDATCCGSRHLAACALLNETPTVEIKNNNRSEYIVGWETSDEVTAVSRTPDLQEVEQRIYELTQTNKRGSCLSKLPFD